MQEVPPSAGGSRRPPWQPGISSGYEEWRGEKQERMCTQKLQKRVKMFNQAFLWSSHPSNVRRNNAHCSESKEIRCTQPKPDTSAAARCSDTALKEEEKKTKHIKS